MTLRCRRQFDHVGATGDQPVTATADSAHDVVVWLGGLCGGWYNELCVAGGSLTMLVRRVTSQLLQLQTLLMTVFASQPGEPQWYNELGVAGGSLTMLVRRVTSQLLQLQTLLMTVFGLREPSNNVNELADLVRDDFGLHKIIVAFTSVGKIYGIDNLSHEIIWQSTLKDVIPFNNIGKAHVPFFIQRTTTHFPNPAQTTVLYRHK
ncbi:DUF1620 super, partial [Homalodisca vitripennis]